jgi:hypothetical protein
LSVDDLPLLEEDGLFFRILPGALASLARRAEGPLLGGPAALAQTFRDAFHAAWERLPLWDRQRLLNYWRPGYEWSSPDERGRGDSPRPLQIVGGALSSSQVSFDKLGHEVNFPALLVVGRRSVCMRAIAQALADTHRVMSGQHWNLLVEMMDKPLERWERKEGVGATDAVRDEMIDALEEEYLRAYKAQVSAILWNWGFPDTAGVAENLPTL